MNKLLFFGIILASSAMILASCQYKSIVEPVIPPPDPLDTISYSAEIEPIYQDAGCISCHSGGQAPDLRAGNSYSSIMNGYVDTEDPAASKIYYYPLPDGGHYQKYTSAQAALLLGWIEQGAMDN